MPRVGQNRIYTPCITIYLVVSLSKIPYIHCIYMVLANPNYALMMYIWWYILQLWLVRLMPALVPTPYTFPTFQLDTTHTFSRQGLWYHHHHIYTVWYKLNRWMDFIPDGEVHFPDHRTVDLPPLFGFPLSAWGAPYLAPCCILCDAQTFSLIVSHKLNLTLFGFPLSAWGAPYLSPCCMLCDAQAFSLIVSHKLNLTLFGFPLSAWGAPYLSPYCMLCDAQAFSLIVRHRLKWICPCPCSKGAGTDGNVCITLQGSEVRRVCVCAWRCVSV